VDDLASNIEKVHARIAAAANRAGRRAEDVQLIAVTKTVSPERVEQALAAGLSVFGESKVQEARAKIPLVSGRARWHMIGHLQTNKARDAVALFDLLHSVDSVKIAGELNKEAERAGKRQPILLEVNVSGERSKFGIAPHDLVGALEQVGAFSRLEVQGLMTITPYSDDPQKARPYFRQLRELAQKFSLPQMSMGMTGDFEVAIEEGATMVRIGTAIFGEPAE
jgi:pyridoxal phosphate enzyme (YggS family)